jgi:large subunit ribosomal protein L16
MLLPKRTKWRKTQKGRVADVTYRGCRNCFWYFCLKSLESGKISNKQIEAARIAFTRFMKREGKVWIRIFPDKANHSVNH